MMYVKWYSVCNSVMISAVEVCVDYGGVYVFHVCLDFCVIYGVGTLNRDCINSTIATVF